MPFISFFTALNNLGSFITILFSSMKTAYKIATAKSLQSCPTLCDPVDSDLPGSPVPGILQARTLEWVAISFSNTWKGKVKVKSLSCVWLLATPWSATYQAPPSMGFSRQEYWSGVPLPSPIKLLILLNSKIKMWKCKQNTNELTFKSLSSNRTTSFGIKSQKLNINSDLKRIYWLFLLKCYN